MCVSQEPSLTCLDFLTVASLFFSASSSPLEHARQDYKRLEIGKAEEAYGV